MVATKNNKVQIPGTIWHNTHKNSQYKWDQRSWRKQLKKHTKSDQKILKKIPGTKKDPN